MSLYLSIPLPGPFRYGVPLTGRRRPQHMGLIATTIYVYLMTGVVIVYGVVVGISAACYGAYRLVRWTAHLYRQRHRSL